MVNFANPPPYSLAKVTVLGSSGEGSQYTAVYWLPSPELPNTFKKHSGDEQTKDYKCRSGRHPWIREYKKKTAHMQCQHLL